MRGFIVPEDRLVDVRMARPELLQCLWIARMRKLYDVSLNLEVLNKCCQALVVIEELHLVFCIVLPENQHHGCAARFGGLIRAGAAKLGQVVREQGDARLYRKRGIFEMFKEALREVRVRLLHVVVVAVATVG